MADIRFHRRAGRLALTGLSLPAGIEGVRVHAGRDGTLDVLLEEPDEFQIVGRIFAVVDGQAGGVTHARLGTDLHRRPRFRLHHR